MKDEMLMFKGLVPGSHCLSWGSPFVSIGEVDTKETIEIGAETRDPERERADFKELIMAGKDRNRTKHRDKEAMMIHAISLPSLSSFFLPPSLSFCALLLSTEGLGRVSSGKKGKRATAWSKSLFPFEEGEEDEGEGEGDDGKVFFFPMTFSFLPARKILPKKVEETREKRQSSKELKSEERSKMGWVLEETKGFLLQENQEERGGGKSHQRTQA